VRRSMSKRAARVAASAMPWRKGDRRTRPERVRVALVTAYKAQPKSSRTCRESCRTKSRRCSSGP
jgi:hypothetical protein